LLDGRSSAWFIHHDIVRNARPAANAAHSTDELLTANHTTIIADAAISCRR